MRHRSGPVMMPAILFLLVALVTGCAGGDTVSEPRPASESPPSEIDVANIAPGMSVVAQAKVPEVEVFAERGGTGTPVHTLSNPTESYGGPLLFLVETGDRDWLQVNLPVRPNGSTGWIRAGDVTLSQHDYRIKVELGAFKITVTKASEVLLAEPVGLGTAETPTPGGKFYTTVLVQPPNPNTVYGPYALGLSGFSNVLTSFGGGDGQAAIHGNNDPATLGREVSAGCIRMSNTGITKLAESLPLGVPVEILP